MFQRPSAPKRTLAACLGHLLAAQGCRGAKAVCIDGLAKGVLHESAGWKNLVLRRGCLQFRAAVLCFVFGWKGNRCVDIAHVDIAHVDLSGLVICVLLA